MVNGTVRTYCDLLCPNADTVYVIKRDPQNHRSCFEFLTYKREKRQDEWYFWRQEVILKSVSISIAYEII